MCLLCYWYVGYTEHAYANSNVLSRLQINLTAFSFLVTIALAGRMKERRNLTSDEILAQMFWARKVCRLKMLPEVSNVVFMGLGEPSDNADNVIRATEILTTRGLFQLSATKVTVRLLFTYIVVRSASCSTGLSHTNVLHHVVRSSGFDCRTHPRFLPPIYGHSLCIGVERPCSKRKTT